MDYLKFRVNDYEIYLFPEGVEAGGQRKSQRKIFLKVVGRDFDVIFVVYATVEDGKLGQLEFKRKYGRQPLCKSALAAIYAYALGELPRESIGYSVISEVIKLPDSPLYRLAVAEDACHKYRVELNSAVHELEKARSACEAERKSKKEIVEAVRKLRKWAEERLRELREGPATEVIARSGISFIDQTLKRLLEIVKD